MPITRVISGGQTGPDRAALDVALESGLACSGWCPRGRVAEDGPIDARYPLKETAGADPADRTRRNVEDADGTLILAGGELTGGTALTRRLALELGRPHLIIDPSCASTAEAVRQVQRWIDEHDIAVLNVAGPRESECPGIYGQGRSLLLALLAGRK
jgi:hypothetical protein